MTDINLNDLLAGDLEDLPDMPVFQTWPAGAYRCNVSCELKEVNDKPVVETRYTLKEVLELADSTAVVPLVGATNSEAFFLDNALGIGKMKEFLKPFAVKFGENQVQALIGMIINIEVDVVNKPRKDKNDKEKTYFTSIAIEVV